MQLSFVLVPTPTLLTACDNLRSCPDDSEDSPPRFAPLCYNTRTFTFRQARGV
jgi:hypothetical protein